MSRKEAVLLQGTLDLLILENLAGGEEHGWGIAERIWERSGEVLRVQQGSLYPALHRLERRGWIASRWGTSDNNRRARFYRLTARGRRRLRTERDGWRFFAAAVARNLGDA
ncbi:MAG: PadR family transcriptional regulator [Thermoanaerobaculia bacterium]|nr:PadR family transcriptional regulator [Thermoanaerobaculia bacterium]